MCSVASRPPPFADPARYDERGRQTHYRESDTQRRDRLAFLQRRHPVALCSTNMSLDLEDYYIPTQPRPSPAHTTTVPSSRQRTPTHQRQLSLSSIAELPEED